MSGIADWLTRRTSPTPRSVSPLPTSNVVRVLHPERASDDCCRCCVVGCSGCHELPCHPDDCGRGEGA